MTEYSQQYDYGRPTTKVPLLMFKACSMVATVAAKHKKKSVAAALSYRHSSIRSECTCVRTCDTSPNPPSLYHTHLLLTSASSWKKRRTKKADKDSKNIQQNSQRLTIRLTETVNYTTINCPCGPKYQISMFPIVILR